MDDLTEDAIGESIFDIARAFDAEYDKMTEAELTDRWWFAYDPTKTLTWNIYLFHDALKLYASSCRRWEEKHNGISCVVERVRDKYLMSKIREFEGTIRGHVMAEITAPGDGWNDDMNAAPLGQVVLVSWIGKDGKPKVARTRHRPDGWWMTGHPIRPYAWRPLPSPAPLPEHREASDHE